MPFSSCLAACCIAVLISSIAGLATRDEFEVDHRHVGRGHADRRAVELALEFRQHEADGGRRTGRRGDQVEGGCARRRMSLWA